MKKKETFEKLKTSRHFDSQVTCAIGLFAIFMASNGFFINLFSGERDPFAGWWVIVFLFLAGLFMFFTGGKGIYLYMKDKEALNSRENKEQAEEKKEGSCANKE